jgi:hypothetical protein
LLAVHDWLRYSNVTSAPRHGQHINESSTGMR